MSHLPSSSPGGSYPASTISNDHYSKLPLSGASNFSSEPHELPGPTSMAQPVPLGADNHDQASSNMRQQYTYMGSGPNSSQMPVNPNTGASEIPRYVDESRPAKSARHAGQPSVHNTGSENPAEYRYSSYPPPAAGGQVAPAYSHDTPGQDSTGHREFYPPSSTWTTSAAEPVSTVAYANGDGRPYSFQGGAPDARAVKPEGRGPYGHVNNYSWNGN